MKSAGVLLHISSLPSKYGIGTFGEEAFKFADFLSETGFKFWQILPLTLTSYGDSPYQSPASIGLNLYFIDLDILIKKGLLFQDEIDSFSWGENNKSIDYGLMFQNRYKILKIAFSRFNKKDDEFISFVEKGIFNDFSLFLTLKELNDFKSWSEWGEEYKYFNKQLFNKIKKENNDLFLFYYWTQFELLNQIAKWKQYCNSKGVKIIGDIPIYVAYDSVDVWKYNNLFQLDSNLNLLNVAGSPPDGFSPEGQFWGNPLYDWKEHKKNNYEWWNNRISFNLTLYDYIRIDHFRGFSGFFSCPFKEGNAVNGKWVKGPGFDFFKDKLKLPIIAEDLGHLDSDFYKMMEQIPFPGMMIMNECFNGDPNSTWKPSNCEENYLYYTSTHDSKTFMQFLNECDLNWRKSVVNEVKVECNKLGIRKKLVQSNKNIIDEIFQLNLASKAKLSMFLFQDLLYLGEEGRMNQPAAQLSTNWTWRIPNNQCYKKICKKFKKWIKNYQRF